MPIGPLKAEATQLIFNPVSNLRKSYEHIGEFHSSIGSMRGMLELSEKVVLVAFILIPLALIAYFAKALIDRVSRPDSARDPSFALPGSETPGGPGNNSYISPYISEALRLEREFDWLLSNLKGELRGDRARRLENDMVRFLADHKEDVSLDSFYTSIRQKQHELQTLKAMGREVFVIPARIQDDGVIRQPGDGNCLFHSLRDGLALVDIAVDSNNSNAIELEHLLRSNIVNWMQANVSRDKTLQDLINRAIEDFIEMKSGQMQIERATAEACIREPENAEKGRKDLEQVEKIEKELQEFRDLLNDPNLANRNRRYFDKVGQPGFFGSKAEIYAFSRMYREVRVEVRHQLNGRFLVGYDFSYNDGQSKSVTLVYVNGDHFDLQGYLKSAQ